MVDVTPHLLQTLFQFISVLHPQVATGTFAVGWRSRACGQPDKGQGYSLAQDPMEWTLALPAREVEKSHSDACPVCWGAVLLKDEEFPSNLVHRLLLAKNI